MSVVLSEHLPLRASAPNGIQKLRGLILELAVRGKLVSQDPNDEPASELLKRIRAEKERLVAEGKIKREKALPAIGEEKPFELPEGWEWVRFGEITNFGFTEKAGQIDDQTWVLDLEDIEKDSSRLLQKLRFSERKSLSDKNSFQTGDVLYGKLRPYLNKVLVADEPGVCTTEILPVRCYGPFNPHYFKTVLKSPYFLEYVNSKSYGMKMPRLGTDDGRAVCFPFPPLPEQSRIVARVEALMALCDRLEAQQGEAARVQAHWTQAALDQLAESGDADEFARNWQALAEHFDTLFSSPASVDALDATLLQLAVRGKLVPQNPADEPASELLKQIRAEKDRLIAAGQIKRDKPLPPVADDEKPFELPEGWEWSRTYEVAESRLGKMLDKAKNTGSAYPYLRNTNVQWNRFDLEDIKEICLEERELEEFRLRPGDLLVCEGGEPGRCAIWREEREMYFQKALHRIRPLCGVLVEYLAICLETDAKTERLAEFFTGATIKHFAGQELNRYFFPLPPLPEQSRIVAKLDELLALTRTLRARLTDARAVQARLASALVDEVAA